MAQFRPTSDTTSGGDGRTDVALLRQSADTVGPRAQRTIARIIDATREVLLTRGYSGTTVDEIARVADVSRASFYTYFASKRSVLLEVGGVTASVSEEVIERLAEAGGSRSLLATWIEEYFDLLDVHGSFSFAWTQAAQEDEDLRIAGMKRHLRMCHRFGEVLAGTAARSAADPIAVGLVAMSVLERSWNYAHLYADTVDRAAVIEQAAQTLWAMARQLPRADVKV